MKLSKLLLTIILFLSILIALKKDINFKAQFYKEVYDTSFNFAYVNKLYTSVFGNPLPFLEDSTSMVFDEELSYEMVEPYKDGAKLQVGSNYLIPSINEGIVIFVGEKDDYGKCVVMLDSDGIERLYGNLSNVSVKMYDYVKKGELVGEVNEELYMVFSKDGEIINYDEYLE